MSRGYRGPPRRRGSREYRPPRSPEKKWEPRLTAHALAFGFIAERVPAYERERIKQELSKLMRTVGADDFLHRRRTRQSSVFVRKAARLFPKNIKVAEDYLFFLLECFSK